MIIGVGIDIVDIPQVEEALESGGDRFIQRLFTDDEQRYCLSRRSPAQHFAARFAAKEAVLKALGTGWRGGIRWTQIDIGIGAQGQPLVHLRDQVRLIAEERGIHGWHLSLTHSREKAAAVVIAEGEPPVRAAS